MIQHRGDGAETEQKRGQKGKQEKEPVEDKAIFLSARIRPPPEMGPVPRESPGPLMSQLL